MCATGVKPRHCPDLARDGVRLEHAEADLRPAGRLRGADDLGQESLCHTRAPSPRTHVDRVEPEVRRPLDPRVGEPERPLVVLGKHDGPGCDLRAKLRPGLVPRPSGDAVRLGHLDLELVPELVQDLLVVAGRLANAHGVRIPVSR